MCLRQLLADRTLFSALFTSATFHIHWTLVTCWDPLSRGVQFYHRCFLRFVSFRVFITVSVVLLAIPVGDAIWDCPRSFFFSFLFFPPRFCPSRISGIVTRRDSKLSVLLVPVVLFCTVAYHPIRFIIFFF